MCLKREERYIFLIPAEIEVRQGIAFPIQSSRPLHETNARFWDKEELHILYITAFCWPVSQLELEHPKTIFAAFFCASKRQKARASISFHFLPAAKPSGPIELCELLELLLLWGEGEQFA